MKHFSKVFLAIIFSLFFVVAGCGSEDENDNNSNADDNTQGLNENLTIFGGSVGGAWSVFTEGISEAVRKENPDAYVTGVPGTVAGNPLAVAVDKRDFAISESLTAHFAYEGSVPFDKPHENIRAVASIMPINVFQFVAPADAPFDSVEEVTNENISIRYSAGEKNALGDAVSESVFEAYDLSYDDIKTNGGEIDFLSGGKSFELMADKRIDGLGKMVPIPAGDILEASATIDMKMIPIGEKAVDHLVEKYGMTPHTIEAGSYDFQKEDYQTVNSPTILITHEEMDEETVYQVTKSIYNHMDYLSDVHNGFKEINDETIIEVGKVPLHLGAERFFKEKGLIE